ncbi:MAG: Cas10/Cmr2 second palm domain-containing protein [Bacteroidota bacterium]
MSKYLYGASIQGIQSFIFQTNKLKEIVGGSELVEEICTTKFYDFINSDDKDENIIVSAAGNIKFIADEDTCKKLVRGFPKHVLQKAPGVTVSQAVVKINDDLPLSEHINRLEEKLKVERNKPVMPLEIGFMGLERARRTGGVAVKLKERKGKKISFCESTALKDKVVDEKSNETGDSSHTKLFKKISGLTEKPKEITLEIEDICKGHKNSWIAVVHADGNGLGNILRVMGEKLKNADFDKSKSAFRAFSRALDNATQDAAQAAFWKVFSKAEAFTSDGKHPIRPIVCGGDDLTFIIRADLALEFTEQFLREFETKTKEEFQVLEQYGINDFKEGITACAGIAYVKESYPLHYALNLSEALCKDAKKKVKEQVEKRDDGIPKSALAFYKVQESFTDKLSILKERTLQAKHGDNLLDYYNGPYLLKDLEGLNERLDYLKDQVVKSQDTTKAIGKLRRVVSDTFKDFSVAEFNLNRMEKVNKAFFNELKLQEELDKLKNLKSSGKKETSQLLDLITLHGFNYGTREN